MINKTIRIYVALFLKSNDEETSHKKKKKK